VSVKKTQSSQFAFAEQAVLHAEASATTPTCRLFVAALSIDPARFRHAVKKGQIHKNYMLYIVDLHIFFTFVFLYTLQ
jgi:hypothetical protein